MSSYAVCHWWKRNWLLMLEKFTCLLFLRIIPHLYWFPAIVGSKESTRNIEVTIKLPMAKYKYTGG